MNSGRTAFAFNARRRGITALAAGGFILLCQLSAAAQETRPPQPVAPPASARNDEPGMFDSMGRWFKDSYNRLSSNVEGARGTISNLGGRAGDAAKDAAGAARETAKDAVDTAKDAADAVARLPNARVVEGRERCAVAANGAPDCRAAAENVCKGKGFGAGSSLDIQSSQKCSARVWLSRSREPGDCETQSFVTRAVCQ
jgi:hypothetical protein